MLTIGEAVAAVRRGAARLDEVQPGWWQRVDVDTLDMASPLRCVLGQTYMAAWFAVDIDDSGSPYEHGKRTLGLNSLRAEEHGFVVLDDEGDPSDHETDALRPLWLAEIDRRRDAASAGQVPTDVPPTAYAVDR